MKQRYSRFASTRVDNAVDEILCHDQNAKQRISFNLFKKLFKRHLLNSYFCVKAIVLAYMNFTVNTPSVIIMQLLSFKNNINFNKEAARLDDREVFSQLPVSI